MRSGGCLTGWEGGSDLQTRIRPKPQPPPRPQPPIRLPQQAGEPVYDDTGAGRLEPSGPKRDDQSPDGVAGHRVRPQLQVHRPGLLGVRMEMTRPPCPLCGGYMLMLYGCGWDYDRWLCGE